MITPFGVIMRRVVEATPGAIGGAFADRHGELVDGYTKAQRSDDWAILTAHYGVIMAHLKAAFGIWHYGGPEFFIAQHKHVGVVVHAVEAGYYALLAVRDPAAPCQRLDLPPVPVTVPVTLPVTILPRRAREKTMPIAVPPPPAPPPPPPRRSRGETRPFDRGTTGTGPYRGGSAWTDRAIAALAALQEAAGELQKEMWA